MASRSAALLRPSSLRAAARTRVMRLIDASAMENTVPRTTSANTQATIHVMVGVYSARRGSAPELLPELAHILLELAVLPLEAQEVDEEPDPHGRVGREEIREVRRAFGHATSPRAGARRLSSATSSASRAPSARSRMSHPARR